MTRWRRGGRGGVSREGGGDEENRVGVGRGGVETGIMWKWGREYERCLEMRMVLKGRCINVRGTMRSGGNWEGCGRDNRSGVGDGGKHEDGCE